ncbi:MAG: alpha/beta fold hydrolase, partial [Rhizomicrobium sp.]
MSTGGKGYVSAPLGQLHYRDIGPHDSSVTLLLFHQSPQNLLQFGAIQNALAARGVRSIAVDTPGYGMSDQPDCIPTIGGLADNMLALFDAKGLEKAVVAGHHTGACIATALAARHPNRVAGIILHGCALFSPQEADEFRRAPEWPRKPVRDGSHLTHIFSKWPSAGDDADLAFKTWISASMFLQGPDIGHFAVYRYDMEADLRRVQAPGLIIAETEDMTHHMDER